MFSEIGARLLAYFIQVCCQRLVETMYFKNLKDPPKKENLSGFLTLLHSEWSKLNRVSAVLSAVGLGLS